MLYKKNLFSKLCCFHNIKGIVKIWKCLFQSHPNRGEGGVLDGSLISICSSRIGVIWMWDFSNGGGEHIWGFTVTIEEYRSLKPVSFLFSYLMARSPPSIERVIDGLFSLWYATQQPYLRKLFFHYLSFIWVPIRRLTKAPPLLRLYVIMLRSTQETKGICSI